MPKPAAYIPMASRPVHVRLRSDVDQVVKALAAREGNTASAVVRRLVTDALQAKGNDARGVPAPPTIAAEGRG